MRNNFVQLFDIKSFERVHLKKDVGMIPAMLKMKYEYNCTIVFYDNQNNRDLDIVENGVLLERLNLNIMNKLKVIELFFSPMIWYIVKHAKEIDCLMLFHLKKQNFIYRTIYKIINPKGKVYIKLDSSANDVKGFEEYRNAEIKKVKISNLNDLKQSFRLIKRKLGFKYLKHEISKFDIVSVETKEALFKINKATQNILSNKIFLLHNGISGTDQALVKRRKYSEKENIIISVGRIGTEVKNNEMLLRAIEKIDMKDWKVYLIGPIDNSFMAKIGEFFEKNPKQKSKIILVGNVEDKSSLYEWYARSKVFCLTSNSEGFPLVFPEALYYGNYIISTKIGADRDITNFGKIGCSISINDHEQLAKIIHAIINDELKIEKYYNSIVEYCDNNFLWENIIDELHNRIVR